jgi:hypothetical protein
LIFINAIAAIFSVLASAVGTGISAEATPSFKDGGTGSGRGYRTI